MDNIDETKLGSAYINQKSIGEEIDQNFIEEVLFQKNLDKFQKSIQSYDIDTYANEFLSYLKIKKN